MPVWGQGGGSIGGGVAAQDGGQHWVGTWGAGPGGPAYLPVVPRLRATGRGTAGIASAASAAVS